MAMLLPNPTAEELDALAALQGHGAWLRVLAWLERGRGEIAEDVIEADADQPVKRGAAKALKEVLGYAASAEETLRAMRGRSDGGFYP